MGKKDKEMLPPVFASIKNRMRRFRKYGLPEVRVKRPERYLNRGARDGRRLQAV